MPSKNIDDAVDQSIADAEKANKRAESRLSFGIRLGTFYYTLLAPILSVLCFIFACSSFYRVATHDKLIVQLLSVITCIGCALGWGVFLKDFLMYCIKEVMTTYTLEMSWMRHRAKASTPSPTVSPTSPVSPTEEPANGN